MAITQVSPVAPQRQTQTKVTPSKTAGGLEKVLGATGAIAGGIAGFAGGGPAGAIAGGIAGAQGGRGLGSFIGESVDPTRAQQIAAPQVQIPQQLQGFKFSQNGMTVLDALASADRLGPEMVEHKEPLVLALMQDIAANNRGGQV